MVFCICALKNRYFVKLGPKNRLFSLFFAIYNLANGAKLEEKHINVSESDRRIPTYITENL